MQMKSLSLLSAKGANRLWQYVTQDTSSQVLEDQYFRSAIDLLREGDFIYVTTPDFDFCVVVVSGDCEVEHLQTMMDCGPEPTNGSTLHA